jgi:hypothetical protein
MKLRLTYLAVASALSSVTVTGCTTTAPMSPVHFYTSWSGRDASTGAVFEAVDTRMRVEPGFIRDLNFDEPMHIEIANGVPVPGDKFEYQIRITIPSRLMGRRIDSARRVLADFSVVCTPSNPQPCVDGVLERARLQPARIRRVLAHSPRA